MKILRITALGAALVLAAAPMAQGQAGQQSGQQDGSARASRRGRSMEALLSGITLSDAQKATVDSIQAAYRTQMPATTPGSAPDPSARAARRELMMKEQAAIRAVLTPEQQKAFDENVAHMRQRGRRGS
jgi:Spy/CpxP family protein refolding chaperone